MLLVLASPAGAQPFVPDRDAVVLEHLPTARDPKLAELRRAHASLARQPTNLNLAVAVAASDVSEARGRFDPRFNGYAQAALAPWWNLQQPPAPVRLLRAMVRQSNHDFAASLADLDALLDEAPHNRQALLVRAVVRQVRGEIGPAAQDCARVAQSGAELAGALCAASVRGLGAELLPAYQELAERLDTADADLTPSLRVWGLTLLAEMAARLGEAAEADRRFAAALQAAPRDAYLLGIYADFLLDHGRPREVIDLLADWTRIDPLLLRLAIAEQRLALPEAARHITDLADRFAASTARGETVHRREQARFTLDLLRQPQTALSLAAANWRVQREPADARILLEAALAAQAPESAADTRAWLEATGLQDPVLRALAGRLNSETKTTRAGVSP